MTILKSSRSGEARSMRATKTIVSDLPEPCVCQTTPERSSGVCAGAQALDDPARRPVLLVAADDLDPLAGIGVHEDRAGAQDVEQGLRGEHALDQPLLLALHAQRRRICRGVLLRLDVLPGVEVLVRRR